MIRIISFLKRNPELTHEEFLRHWREVHVPMIENNAEVLGVVRYAIVAATEPEATARFNPLVAVEDQYDGVGELWLDSGDRVNRPPSPEAAAVLEEISADEHAFVDSAHCYRLLGEETRIIGGEVA